MTDDAGLSKTGQQDDSRGDSQKVITEIHEVSFSGPLPPPEMIESYESILPGAADRIIRLAEYQAKHRQQLEMATVKATVDDMHAERSERRIGQFLGATIAIAGLVSGALIVVNTDSLPGTIGGTVLGGSGLVAIVSIFVLGRKDNTESEDE